MVTLDGHMGWVTWEDHTRWSHGMVTWDCHMGWVTWDSHMGWSHKTVTWDCHMGWVTWDGSYGMVKVSSFFKTGGYTKCVIYKYQTKFQKHLTQKCDFLRTHTS